MLYIFFCFALFNLKCEIKNWTLFFFRKLNNRVNKKRDLIFSFPWTETLIIYKKGVYDIWWRGVKQHEFYFRFIYNSIQSSAWATFILGNYQTMNIYRNHQNIKRATPLVVITGIILPSLSSHNIHPPPSSHLISFPPSPPIISIPRHLLMPYPSLPLLP